MFLYFYYQILTLIPARGVYGNFNISEWGLGTAYVIPGCVSRWGLVLVVWLLLLFGVALWSWPSTLTWSNMYKNLYYTIRKGLEPALTMSQILVNDGDVGSGLPWEVSAPVRSVSPHCGYRAPVRSVSSRGKCQLPWEVSKYLDYHIHFWYRCWRSKILKVDLLIFRPS